MTLSTGESGRDAQQRGFLAARLTGRDLLDGMIQADLLPGLEVVAQVPPSSSADARSVPWAISSGNHRGQLDRPRPVLAQQKLPDERPRAPGRQAQQRRDMRRGELHPGLHQLARTAQTGLLQHPISRSAALGISQCGAAPDEAAPTLLGIDPPVLPQRRQRLDDRRPGHPELAVTSWCSDGSSVPGGVLAGQTSAAGSRRLPARTSAARSRSS